MCTVSLSVLSCACRDWPITSAWRDPPLGKNAEHLFHIRHWHWGACFPSAAFPSCPLFFFFPSKSSQTSVHVPKCQLPAQNALINTTENNTLLTNMNDTIYANELFLRSHMGMKVSAKNLTAQYSKYSIINHVFFYFFLYNLSSSWNSNIKHQCVEFCFACNKSMQQCLISSNTFL